MDAFNKAFVVIVATIGIVISRGFAISLIWNMFMPQFFGLPTLPTLIAIALSTLLAVIMPSAPYRNNSGVTEKEYSGILYNMLFLSFVTPWVGYLFALATTNLYY